LLLSPFSFVDEVGNYLESVLEENFWYPLGNSLMIPHWSRGGGHSFNPCSPELNSVVRKTVLVEECNVSALGFQ
jgi:hypothetical protein